jgi:hypothetical protein
MNRNTESKIYSLLKIENKPIGNVKTVNETA